MRRLVSSLAGIAIAAVLLRLVRRLRRPAGEPEPAPADPATELRKSLDAARTAAATEAAPAGPSLAERRERVHVKAQEAIDLMRDGDGEPR